MEIGQWMRRNEKRRSADETPISLPRACFVRPAITRRIEKRWNPPQVIDWKRGVQIAPERSGVRQLMAFADVWPEIA